MHVSAAVNILTFAIRISKIRILFGIKRAVHVRIKFLKLVRTEKGLICDRQCTCMYCYFSETLHISLQNR